jgi:hypothetical protein
LASASQALEMSSAMAGTAPRYIDKPRCFTSPPAYCILSTRDPCLGFAFCLRRTARILQHALAPTARARTSSRCRRVTPAAGRADGGGRHAAPDRHSRASPDAHAARTSCRDPATRAARRRPRGPGRLLPRAWTSKGARRSHAPCNYSPPATSTARATSRSSLKGRAGARRRRSARSCRLWTAAAGVRAYGAREDAICTVAPIQRGPCTPRLPRACGRPSRTHPTASKAPRRARLLAPRD